MADGSVTIDTKLDNSGFKSGLGKIGSIAKTALKGMTIAVGAVTTAFAGMATASVKARGEIEQSIGGVETLFKDSANKVIENANKAYKTAGMSANDYMQQVTSFSASLLQSVAGDTNKAADIADMAMTDMSDNANKMGTSMEAITNAYQGFAKQNYTMLDNLKLGYGGTKTEMERLLKDAQKLTGVKYDINNLSDVYEAIHAIQGELGITGTTALEAEKTLTGSIASLKASWQNFLSGAGDLSQVVKSASTAFKNILRIAGEAIPSIITAINESLPEILELGGQIFIQLAKGIANNLPQIINTAITIIQTLLNGLISNLPMIIQAGIQAIQQLILGIAQMLPTLIPQAVECIITIVEGLLDNIDMIIDAGIELIIGLAMGLVEALPKLIEKIPEIIEKLINAIVRNLPKIIEAGILLILKLAEGLIKAIPQLISKIPQIIGALLNGLGEAVSKTVEIGSNIIKGLWQGISNMGSWIANKIKGFGEGVLNGLKSFFGIHSPSTVFRDEIGKYLAMGVGEGFEDNISKVYRQMKSAVNFETQKLSTNLSTTATMSKIITANINVNGNVEMDSTRVGRLVAPSVTRTIKAGGLA